VIRSKTIFLLAFLTAFGAGLSVGLLWQRSSSAEKAPVQQPPNPHDWMAELNLTPDQKEKIKAIWTEAMKNNTWPQQREIRDAAAVERDEAFKAMLNAEQKTKYDDILATYQKKMDDLNAENKKSRDAAYEKTKAVLNETQRVQYDELRKKRFEGRGRRPEGGKPPAGAPDKKPEAETKKPDADVKKKDE
jgi:Spy/CpxP family protein refolding chaperone